MQVFGNGEPEEENQTGHEQHAGDHAEEQPEDQGLTVTERRQIADLMKWERTPFVSAWIAG